ncbi:glycerophosphodiester phosphodiesterase [Bhargavaea ullalensis]|uniref:Glycerophosphoryl diester phosphodiesterase n=1 Tax=Bhargavaea ullalensis TaxID=1265685 RepID=A0ABV2GF82_9BACL
MEIFAHRGASGSCPENTMAAFRKTAGLAITGVEFDVHLTADGEPVVIHDETVDRTTDGNGMVKDLTLSEIKKLDAGSWFSREFEGERIPTLMEVLALFEHTPHRLNIELKSDVFPYPGMREKVIAAVREFGLEQRVILSSFDHETIREAKREAPEIETGVLFMEILADGPGYAASIGGDALHSAIPYAVRESGQRAAAEGAVIRVFTVNSREHAEMVRRSGARAIFTDHPEEMAGLFGG